MLAQQGGEVGGDLVLGAAGEADVDDLLEVASAPAPAAASRSSSSGSLTARSIGSASVRRRSSLSGSARCSPNRCIAQAASEMAYRPSRVEQRRGGPVGVVAVEPVGQRTAGSRRGRLRGVGPLQVGHDHRRLTRSADHEHREPLGDRGRRVAGEVGQVRPGRHEHPGQPGSAACLAARSIRSAKSSVVNGRVIGAPARSSRETAPRRARGARSLTGRRSRHRVAHAATRLAVRDNPHHAS